jgi:hypothetical protein
MPALSRDSRGVRLGAVSPAQGGGVRYPDVLCEHVTLEHVVNGASIARFGDGELRQADRVCNIKPQVASASLTARLQDILKYGGADCIIGIPNINGRGPKDLHWQTYTWAARLLNPQQTYGSAFITRPDSAPWINEDGYWNLLESLWRGRDVTLVRGAQKSLTKDDLLRWGAKSVREVLCKPQNAWDDYDQVLADVGTPERALLCLGPTATVMAFDLCKKGVHAIDLGHVGMFYKKRERGLPMWVEKADKVAL